MTSMYRWGFWVGVAALAALVVYPSTVMRANGTALVDLVRVPDGGLQPDVAVGGDGRVHMIYFAGEPAHGDVFYTRLDSDGRFAPAARVNSQPGSVLATGNVRGAHLALGGGRVHVAWVGSDRAVKTGDVAPMLYTRSDEAGRALGSDEIGEICLRTPANMVGYYKHPEATQAARP